MMFHKCLLVAFVLFKLHYEDVEAQIVARNVPLCVRADDPALMRAPPEYREFIPIFRNPDKYFKDIHLELRESRQTSPDVVPRGDGFNILQWIGISKINLDINKVIKKELVEPGKPLGDGKTLNQWFHIQIKTKKRIEGLIVQVIKGPVGLPFGRFVELAGQRSQRCGCTDCTLSVKNFVSFPCTYKSRASARHPDIFTWHARYDRRNPETGLTNGAEDTMDEIHMNFNFIDVNCNRASIFQFLVLAIESFGGGNEDSIVAEAAFTYAIVQKVPASIDGVPYPYHPDFCNALLCGEGRRDEVPSVLTEELHIFTKFEIERTTKIRYNLEYDMCIRQSPVNPAITDCPPGPFRCNGISILDGTLLEQSEIIINLVKNSTTCVCVEGGTSTEQTSLSMVRAPTPEPWDDLELHEDERTEDPIIPPVTPPRVTISRFENISEEVRRHLEAIYTFHEAGGQARLVHGLLMFFAFSVACSVSMFVARFDQDILPGIGCCAKGMWLWAHVLIAFLASSMMWAGILVIVLTDNSDWILTIPHAIIGCIAVVIFHVNFFFGWIRPIGRTFRGIYITIHAIFGYSAKFVAVLTMLVTKTVIESISFYPIIIIFAIECANLLFYGINTLVQCLTDSHMEMKIKRRVCPFVEHKDLSGPVPASCGILRNLIVVLHIIVHICIFAVSIIFWPDPIIRSFIDIYAPGNWDFIFSNNVTTSIPMIR